MKESLILQYILNHPRGWMEDFKKKKIRIHTDKTLMIFNYEIEADFSDPIVQEARGLIIDIATWDIVCWPFRKFGNSIESYADKIDWDSAKVQEKVDGSIVKLYWYNGKWNWATNGVIDAAKAFVPNTTLSFLDLIHKAKNYNDIPFYNLSHYNTYIFELVSPFNKVVIDYKTPMLYHLGARSNETGEEFNIDIGIQKPKEYPIHTYEAALAAATELNAGTTEVKSEGFVVVDKNWHRVKIKSPEYLAAHHQWNNNKYLINKNEALKAILNGDAEFYGTSGYEYLTQWSFYNYQLNLFKWEVARYISHVRILYEEYSYERKAVATEIKGDKLAYFGFKAIGNNLTVDDIIAKMQIPQIAKYIPNFELPNFLNK